MKLDRTVCMGIAGLSVIAAVLISSVTAALARKDAAFHAAAFAAAGNCPSSLRSVEHEQPAPPVGSLALVLL